MAGFTSLDNLITNVSNSGKFFRADWNKNHATGGTVIAGTWQALAMGAGNPPANTSHVAAVTKTWHPSYDFVTANAGIQHNGFVNAAGDGYKVILNASIFSGAATSAPCVWMLVDVLAYSQLTAATLASAGTYTFLNTENVTFEDGTGYLRMITANDYDSYTPFSMTTAGALPTGLTAGVIYYTVRVDATHSKIFPTLGDAIANTNVITYTNAGTPANTLTCRWPRYSDGAGVDVLTYNIVNAATSGSATLKLIYTNAAGTGSKETPATLPASTTVTPLLGITYSGTAAGKYGPFLPRAAGDTGVQSMQSLTTVGNLSSGAWGVLAVRPLLTLPITTIGVASERDLVNQLPSMPRVYDGACLQWLVYTQAAIPNNTAYYGHIDFGWS
jgi:hypothetical protein